MTIVPRRIRSPTRRVAELEDAVLKILGDGKLAVTVNEIVEKFNVSYMQAYYALRRLESRGEITCVTIGGQGGLKLCSKNTVLLENKLRIIIEKIMAVAERHRSNCVSKCCSVRVRTLVNALIKELIRELGVNVWINDERSIWKLKRIVIGLLRMQGIEVRRVNNKKMSAAVVCRP
mgnify:CR=1 FL=1